MGKMNEKCGSSSEHDSGDEDGQETYEPRSFRFPKGKEPYKWAMEKMHACWRGYKCDLKVTLFDGRSHDEAISKRPEHLPLETWANLVQFWESDKGKEKGNKTDKLTIWLKTHAPKKAAKLDDASEAIENEFSYIEEDLCNDATRDEIFKKVVGEDKYDYAKTFGIGVKVPRSTSKRCTLEEERARRRKIEQEQQQSQEKIERLESKLGYVTNLVKVLLKHQGISDDVLSSFEEDEDIEGAHESGDAFEEENAEEVDD